ncbi:MAG: hypothetical protein JWO71_2867 [Candidatus Acidoferrum typicum]|nr:hypothetical protein [Candidatus Acidoferrum typicum]
MNGFSQGSACSHGESQAEKTRVETRKGAESEQGNLCGGYGAGGFRLDAAPADGAAADRFFYGAE